MCASYAIRSSWCDRRSAASSSSRAEASENATSDAPSAERCASVPRFGQLLLERRAAAGRVVEAALQLADLVLEARLPVRLALRLPRAEALLQARALLREVRSGGPLVGGGPLLRLTSGRAARALSREVRARLCRVLLRGGPAPRRHGEVVLQPLHAELEGLELARDLRGVAPR